MPHRDRWNYEHDRERDRDWERRRADLEPEEDFGQADYSTDYAYDPRSRSGYRVREDYDRDDYGQADYSEDFGYDERGHSGYRRGDLRARRDYEEDRGDWHYADERRDRRWHYADERRDHDRERRDEPRSWFDQARDSVSGFFSGAAGASAEDRAARRHRRDRVTWAVITGRLDHERGLDPSEIEVLVHDSEVTLNGTVRSREEKRLAEDLADVRGVTHVQNNLRIRRSFWR